VTSTPTPHDAHPTAVVPTQDVADPAAEIESVIALVEALIDVISEENRILASGLPASLSTVSGRKQTLADSFEQHVRRIRSRELDIAAAREPRRARLVDRTAVLRRAMDENLDRLQTAIAASRHRVEAIMAAIREQIAPPAGYGSNGAQRLAGAANLKAGLRA
jgi:hypothetical protein